MFINIYLSLIWTNIENLQKPQEEYGSMIYEMHAILFLVCYYFIMTEKQIYPYKIQLCLYRRQ